MTSTPQKQRTPGKRRRDAFKTPTRTPTKPLLDLVTSDILSPPASRRRRQPSQSKKRRESIYSQSGKTRSRSERRTRGCTATQAPDATPTPAPHSRTYEMRPRKDSSSSTLHPTPSLPPSTTTTQLPTKPTSTSDGSAPATPSRIGTRTRTRTHHNSRSRTNWQFQNDSSPAMASAAGKWREEQILIICPGSRTTMAQLGCSELTPPAHRLPTRMFRDGEDWRPYFTFRRMKMVDGVGVEEWVEDVDEDKGAVWPMEGGRIVHMDAFLAFLDHVHGTLTTTYHNTPIMLMASPQWTRPDCETIARYIFERTKTPALCMIHSGLATQYGLKWPNMTVVDIGFEKVDVTAIHDGRVVNHMDLGSAQPHRQISGGEVFTQKLLGLLRQKGFDRDMAEQLKRSAICEVLPYAAGEKDLVELPRETTTTPSSATATATATATLSAAAGGEQNHDNDVPEIVEPANANARTGEHHHDAPEEGDGQDHNMDDDDDDGVLDVASIVTSGQTKEFLAKKEKEREKGRPGRKPKDKEAEAGRPVRLPNSRKMRNTFVYEEIVQEEVAKEQEQQQQQEEESGSGAAPVPEAVPEAAAAEEKPPAEEENRAAAGTEEAPPAAAAPAAAQEVIEAPEAAAATETKPVETNPAETETKPAAAENGSAEAAPAPAPANGSKSPETRPTRIRRDIEVGLERFLFAERAEIDRIVRTIYRTIQGIDDMYMRPACWDNLVFVGNGSRLRGLKENILQTLHARHLISPSTATMFTSELPSNVATPMGTGAQTPTGSFSGAPPHQFPASASGVNPLLQAATTASTLGAAMQAQMLQQQGGQVGVPGAVQGVQGVPGVQMMVVPGSEAAGPAASSHHFHSQTPTSIKTANLPGYLSEWTKNGFEEGMFLGAQVAARIAFCLHSNIDAPGLEAQRMMSLSRVDYNEMGPKAIRNHSMLG